MLLEGWMDAITDIYLGFGIHCKVLVAKPGTVLNEEKISMFVNCLQTVFLK